jgi:cytochrome c
MFSLRKPLALLALLAMGVAAGPAAAQGKSAEDRYPGVGRNATGKEVLAWDIDVRPDFKGLPPGSGSVQKGMDVWEAKCASCHGVFGESNEVFSPLVGGTTADDIRTGHVARLKDPDFEGLRRFIASHNLYKSRVFEVARFVLFSSRPSRGGGPYAVEESYILQAGL